MLALLPSPLLAFIFMDPLEPLWLILFVLVHAGAAYGGMYVRGGRAVLREMRTAATIGIVLGFFVFWALHSIIITLELEIPALWFLGQLPGLAIAFALGWWWTTPPDYEERVVLGGYRAVEETQRPKRRVGKRKRPKPGTPSES